MLYHPPGTSSPAARSHPPPPNHQHATTCPKKTGIADPSLDGCKEPLGMLMRLAAVGRHVVYTRFRGRRKRLNIPGRIRYTRVEWTCMWMDGP